MWREEGKCRGRKVSEILSRAVMSGRQRVDTQHMLANLCFMFLICLGVLNNEQWWYLSSASSPWMNVAERAFCQELLYTPWERIERMSLRPYLVVSAPNTGVSNVCEAENVPLLVQNLCVKCVLSMRGPSPPSVYLGRR